MINWKLRGQNKATLMAIAALIIQMAYRIMDAAGVIPPVSSEWVLELIADGLSLLVLLGVIVDPTTDGIGDSIRAMGYDEPWRDKPPDEDPDGNEE